MTVHESMGECLWVDQSFVPQQVLGAEVASGGKAASDSEVASE